jgi:signal transduction histidine kinase/ligand-binding sensor domain-containing protein
MAKPSVRSQSSSSTSCRGGAGGLHECPYVLSWLLLLVWALTAPVQASILWSDLGETLVRESGAGSDVLGGAIQRDDRADDTLYFKFHVDPLSDVATEEFMAAFQLYEGDTERLGVGNAFKAWAYSAYNTAGSGQFNNVFGDVDLKSSRPESSGPGVFLPYELPRRGIESTIVIRVDYVPGADDRIIVWLNPDLAPGATEAGQPEALTTRFSADASFNQIRLRHIGGGGGWSFSDMAIATAFGDLVTGGGADPGRALAGTGRSSLPFTFRTWQREQGLPHNSVRAIIQTRDGYLWIGSDDGVARFDGVRFVSFGLREGLRNGLVRNLLEDREGALWIGTAGGGLTRWYEGEFTTLTVTNGLPADSITALAEDNSGRLWIGTENGLVFRQNGQISSSSAAEAFKGKRITTLYKDNAGVLWVGVKGAGIFRLAGERFEPLTNQGVETLLLDSHCLLVDQASRIWVGAGDDFVLCREQGQWRRYRIPRHLARPYISSLAEEPDGTVWAGSVSEGLFQFKAGKLTAINASSGLSDNLVESLSVDVEGNLWVGTGAGLTRLRRKSLTAFGYNEGLGYGAVHGLAETAPGIIRAAKPGEGLYCWEGRTFSRCDVPGLPLMEVNALLRGKDGACWVAANGGVHQLAAPTERSSAAQLIGLKNLNVLSLAEARDGLWAGTREGELWRLRGKEWAVEPLPPPRSPVTAIVNDRDDVVWVGTDGAGLYQMKGGVRTRFSKQGGLLSDSIRTLFLDSEGGLWIGTAGGGLSHWREGHLNTFTAQEGLPDNTISQILEDSAGRLWLGSRRGIARVRKNELADLAAGKVSAIYPQIYGQPEGMLSEECTGGFHPAGLKTKAGLLWFSTLKGAVVADPRPQTLDTPPPSVVLEQVLVDSVEADLRPRPRSRRKPASGSAAAAGAKPGSEIKIAAGKRRLEFQYTGLSFSAPERVRFRYRLEGLDSDWVDAGTRRAAFYSYLPPGNYRFRVIACNSDGVWNQEGASLALAVSPRFWQAWWFVGAFALALLGSVGGAVRFVEKRKLQGHLEQIEQERALERERARIAQDLHDDLGSSLTRISLLSHLAKADKDNPGQVEIHANKISQSASQTVRALEEIVWALRPGSDTLQSLVDYISHFANELCEGDSLRCRLDLPRDLPAVPLPPEMRHNIFLIVKEALANALKHAAASEIRLQVKSSSDSLEIVVQDNGRGFDPAALAENSERHGLGNMRRRTEAMGGTLETRSAPGGGATVRLFVKFPPAQT